MSEREFVVINEEAARTAQNMMSFNEYQLGSRTKEYQEDVNEVYDLAEEVVARRGVLPRKRVSGANRRPERSHQKLSKIRDSGRNEQIKSRKRKAPGRQGTF